MRRTELGRAYEQRTGNRLLVMAATYLYAVLVAEQAGFDEGDLVYIRPDPHGGYPQALRGRRDVRLHVVGPYIPLDPIRSQLAACNIELVAGI